LRLNMNLSLIPPGSEAFDNLSPSPQHSQ
jgi:hypothetical protein